MLGLLREISQWLLISEVNKSIVSLLKHVAQSFCSAVSYNNADFNSCKCGGLYNRSKSPTFIYYFVSDWICVRVYFFNYFYCHYYQLSALTFRFNKNPKNPESPWNYKYFFLLWFIILCTSIALLMLMSLCCDNYSNINRVALCFLSLEWAETGYIGADMNKPKPYNKQLPIWRGATKNMKVYITNTLCKIIIITEKYFH